MSHTSGMHHKYVPHNTNKTHTDDQHYYTRNDTPLLDTPPSSAPRKVETNVNKVKQIRSATAKSTNGFCTTRNIIIIVCVILVLLIIGGIIAGVVIATRNNSSSNTTTAATASATTSTNSSAIPNPCGSGALWNTVGVNILSSTQISSFQPTGMCVDSNNTLYITDEVTNAVVWKLLYGGTTATNAAGTYQSAGSTSTQFNYPQDTYVGASGNMYVTDYYNYRVQKFASGSSSGTTIAGITGSGGSSLNIFNGLRYFTFDANETYMYVTDYNNHRIMRYSTSSSSGTNGVLAAGATGSAGNSNSTLYYPWGVHMLQSVSSDLFISNYYGHSIIRWSPTASSGYFVAGVPGTSGQTPVLLNYPMGVKIDSYLNLYVVDQGNHRVQLFCANSQTGITIAGTGVAGSSSTQLNSPRGMAFDSYMNLYVSDTGNARIQKFAKL